MKSLEVDHARGGEVIVAYAMNGQPLPLVNGFPIRLIVPGWYSTFWVKLLSNIEVLDKVGDKYWMSKAYQVPDNDAASTTPDQKEVKIKPITAMTPRSFITNFQDGAQVNMGQDTLTRGIAFSGNSGAAKVAFSADGDNEGVQGAR